MIHTRPAASSMGSARVDSSERTRSPGNLFRERVHEQPVGPLVPLGPDRLARLRRSAPEVEEAAAGLFGQCRCEFVLFDQHALHSYMAGGRSRLATLLAAVTGQPVMSVDQLQRFLADSFPGPAVPHVVEARLRHGCAGAPARGIEQSRPGGTVSGPALMSLADCAAWLVIVAQIGPVALSVTTSLHIDFLRRPALVDLIAEGTLLKLGKRLAVADVALTRSTASPGGQGPGHLLHPARQRSASGTAPPRRPTSRHGLSAPFIAETVGPCQHRMQPARGKRPCTIS